MDKRITNVFKHINKRNGFVVPILFLFFHSLKKVSLFPLFIKIVEKILGKDYTKNNYIIPEIWVVLNFSLATFGRYLLIQTNNKSFAYIFLFISMFRIFAILIYQINVLFFDRYEQWYLYPTTGEYKDCYQIQSGTRMVILLLINMMEYILHFYVIYLAISIISGTPIAAMSFMDSFKLFFNMQDFGKFRDSVIGGCAYAEVCVGMFTNVLCIARMLNLFPNVNQAV